MTADYAQVDPDPVPLRDVTRAAPGGPAAGVPRGCARATRRRTGELVLARTGQNAGACRSSLNNEYACERRSDEQQLQKTLAIPHLPFHLHLSFSPRSDLAG